MIGIAWAFSACGNQAVQVGDLSGTKVGKHAAMELAGYLDELYRGADFSCVESGRDAQIQYLLTSQVINMGIEIGELPQRTEAFRVADYHGKWMIIAHDERGLLDATYALLEKLGCGFYISGDVLPTPVRWHGFDGWEMEDEPLTGDRFVFDWHNFLSGCTGWNLPEWQSWIDQAAKMRYNGIMVHAYGNNPMFSFEYLGERKPTGYLNNTASGRNWGNQHVNDVRHLVGGEIFDGPVYGSEASMASEENKNDAATALMQQVFQYAEDRGTKVIFALDFDTWMANPRNIMEKLPAEALFDLGKGHPAPNPSHPAGYAYFEQVLRSLLEMYPQIDQLSVWHRRPSLVPGQATIWMDFPYEKMPEQWKKEYAECLVKHPEIDDDLRATSMFAYGKLIEALQRARDRIKPELEISSGSWQFHYVKYADAFFPRDVALIPLDWEVVFDQPEARSTLVRAGANRDIYPVLWAHHDDHRYIGRPYTPWEDLSSMLDERNARGFGIIHWTTRPLDLYFTSSSRQVWMATRNEPVKTTVDKFVVDLVGENHQQLAGYYLSWLTDGPMFGRETTDHFIDLGTQHTGRGLESWEVMREKTHQRWELINTLPVVEDTDILMYQRQMEEFYLSFFENQILFQKAYDHAEAGEINEGILAMEKTDPERTIRKYIQAIENAGFSSGEKALVFSMNTRWLADYYNLEQRLGMRPVHLIFSPTRHDPLAQSPGHFSYNIDDEKLWWRCIWEKEWEENRFGYHDGKPALMVKGEWSFSLQTMHGQPLPEGDYQVELLLTGDEPLQGLTVFQEGHSGKHAVKVRRTATGVSLEVSTAHGRSILISAEKEIFIKGIKLTKLP
jgi:hypothetical protein